jgi:oligopeptide/dipeptide ABC transporter ATP-binding protein
MSKFFEAEKLQVSYRKKGRLRTLFKRDHSPYLDAVQNVSFSMKAGETFGLVGESGSGKTTLARSIMGVLKPRKGHIRFDGQDLNLLAGKALKSYRRKVAMMFQDPVASLSPRLRIGSILKEPFRIHGMTGLNLSAEIEHLLGMVGLPVAMSKMYPHQLSGGQARRVGVARALSLAPKLIIADEPTAGLDVSVQGEVLNLMANLQRDSSMSFFIITHNLAIVRHVSDRIAVMYLGRFVEQGPTREIFRRARHPYTHALLSATPNPEKQKPYKTVQLRDEVPSLWNRPQGCEFHTRCPFVRKRCRLKIPSASEAGPGHFYHCHYPLNEH